jgi:hypothetical protein
MMITMTSYHHYEITLLLFLVFFFHDHFHLTLNDANLVCRLLILVRKWPKVDMGLHIVLARLFAQYCPNCPFT